AGRMHFLIELDAMFCRLTNQSDRGTFVNGMLVQTQCDLRHGDLIRAGRSVFRVEIRRRGAAVELPPSPTGLWRSISDTTGLADEPPPQPSLCRRSCPCSCPDIGCCDSLAWAAWEPCGWWRITPANRRPAS